MVRNECVNFGGHLDRQVNYKILLLKYQIMLKLCTIHLVFERGYYEAVLVENTPRTLGVEEGSV
jgi:hypothetical protein